MPSCTGRVWSAPIQVNSAGSDNAYSPEVAVDDAGNAVVVFRQFVGSRHIPVSNRYGVANGDGGFEDARTISRDDAGETDEVAFSMNLQGTGVAVWTERAPSGYNRIWANRLQGGVSWAGPEQVDVSASVASSRRPGVAINPAGNAFVVWEESGHVFATRYRVDTGWSDAGRLDSYDAGASYPDVAADGLGNAMVVWRQDTGMGVFTLANRFVADAGWEGEHNIDPAVGGTDDLSPRVALDRFGNGVASWPVQFGTKLQTSIFSVTQGWQDAGCIKTFPGQPVDSQRIAVDSQGNIIVVWRHTIAENRIVANQYAVDAGWMGGRTLDPTGLFPSAPFVAVDPAGNATAVWASNISGGQVWTAWNRVESGWFGVPEKIYGRAGNVGATPRVAVDGTGNAIVVWDQEDTGGQPRYRVWASWSR